MVKLIIFDLDGTIADTFDITVEIYNGLAAKYKLARITKNKKLRDMGMREVIRKFKIPFFKILPLTREHQKILSESIASVKIFPNLKNILLKLDKNYKLGLITSNDKNNVLKFLRKNKIENIFDFIESGSPLFGKDKILKKIIKRTKYGRECIVYVGDEVRDIEAAKKVGIKIISVGWGFNSSSGLKKSNPDYFVEKPNILLHTIEVLGSR